eukprot:588275-Ditylum_brightwellii.AAC.2
MKEIFNGHFKCTCTEGNFLRYLNACIIISPHGISIDITDHIIRNVLADYWKDFKAPFTSSPFPLKSFFEQELFFAPTLIGQELKEIEQQHNGFLYTWGSTLQFVVQRTQIDLGYAVMQISSYMSAPNNPIFDVLHQTMAFLYHHPHQPLLYPRKRLTQAKMAGHFGSGNAEYLKEYKSFLIGAAD